MTDQHQHQLKYFGNEFAQLSEYDIVPWQKSYIDRISKYLLPKQKPSLKITVLDIATGSGYVAIELAKKGYKVLACDLTPESVNKVKAWKQKFKLKNLKVFTSHAEKIKLPSQSVDLIIANAILEHIPDEAGAIKEWKRIMKKNGKIFITVPLKFRYLWPFLWPINWLYDKRISHLRRYDLQDLEKKFNLSSTYVSYTGHLVKVIGAFTPAIFKNRNFEKEIEIYDAKEDQTKYGASNIIAILTKSPQ